MRLLGSFFHIAMNGMAASDKIFALFDLEEDEKGSKSLTTDDRTISLENVDFSYDETRKILKDINLKIPGGRFISIVGESGCGKSTVAGLISGSIRSQRGEIRIAGIQTKDIKEEELFRSITLVKHNSYIFKGTVEDNLKMAKEDATPEEMKEVLGKVNLLEFLAGGDGLHTAVNERGSNLSGGQRQRLCMARALLHDSPVYIFDEATSNIDAESEEMIMKVIRELTHTKTVLLISHRLANVVDSDKIYMMKAGRIIEEGTHNELIQKNGDYMKLYNRQKTLESYGRRRSSSTGR